MQLWGGDVKYAIGHRSQLIVIFFSQLMSWIALQSISPVLPLYIRFLGFSIADLGTISAFLGLALIIFEPLWGLLINTLGAEKIFTLSVLMSALIAFSYTFVRDFTGFILLRFLSGISASASGVSTRTLACQAIPKTEKAFGVWYAIFSAAGLIGPAIGGYTANMDYNLAFYMSAFIAAIALFSSIGITKSEGDKLNRKFSDANISKTERETLLITATLIILPIFLRYVYQTFMPVFARERLLLSPLEIGLVFTVMGVVGFFAPLIFGEISNKLGLKKIIISGMLLLALAFLLLPNATDIVMLCASAIVLGFGNAAVGPPMMSLLTGNIRLSNRGIAIGVYGAGEDIGILIGPLIVGYFYQAYSPELSFYLTAGLMLINTAFSTFLLRRFSPS
ncbi:MAG: MFS transporter [Candidatus Bathyarchaeia archaeon]